jgi:hypothetical protein
MVHPDWQGKGLGSILQQRLIEYAKRHRLRGFTADVLAENAPMIKVFEKSGCRVESRLVAGAYEVVIHFDIEPDPNAAAETQGDRPAVERSAEASSPSAPAADAPGRRSAEGDGGTAAVPPRKSLWRRFVIWFNGGELDP